MRPGKSRDSVNRGFNLYIFRKSKFTVNGKISIEELQFNEY